MMVQLADLFSVPEMGLMCNVADYFDRNHIDYHPEILFRDIKVSSVFGNLNIKEKLVHFLMKTHFFNYNVVQYFFKYYNIILYCIF